MSENERILCLCCNRRITRAQERQHRRSYNKHPSIPVEPPAKRLRLDLILNQAGVVFLDAPDAVQEGVVDNMPAAEAISPEIGHSSPGPVLPSPDVDTRFDASEVNGTTLSEEDGPVVEPRYVEIPNYARDRRFAATVEDVEDDDEEIQGDDGEEIPLEDNPDLDDEDEEGYAVNWEALADELASMDLSGADFEAEAASIAHKLDVYDRLLCRAYAYKHKSHTSDESFEYLPQVFLAEPLPSLARLRTRIAFLSGFKPEVYDCCVNSCCCYVGPHADLKNCPFCDEPRFKADGKTPRKRFVYIPLIPRLIALARNERLALLMNYRHHYCTTEAQDGVCADIFDGNHYCCLCTRKVKIDGHEFAHTYFQDPRDVALGLSTDGFAPFNKRKKTAWPLILFNYNLPPDIRFHAEHVLSLGVIPGPNKPKDPDSFLWPLLQELFRLAQGIKALDILTKLYFLLRAFLIVVFGDIPAMSMIMHMKGHNGICPCRFCEIKGLRVPGSRATVHYVPLNRSTHPVVRGNKDLVRAYNPQDLPLRTHSTLLTQAREVDLASTVSEASELSKQYGIKGLPLLSYLDSLSFPASFPYDFMHLIWENLIPNLVLHWTGAFKGLDSGSYQVAEAVWEAVGEETARAGSTIPSAYGTRVPNIATDRSSFTAEAWSFWTLYIGPVVLRRRFKDQKYYTHFISLVTLLNKCLQFSLTNDEIAEIREGFIEWVKLYEKYYYQNKPDRLSTCPLTIHALLHIADCIEAMGPVWAYWAFPMERYCGRIKKGIRSRRFPYASLDRFVLEDAQLTQIKVFYDLAQELSLKPPKEQHSKPRGACKPRGYQSCLLLPPRKRDPQLDDGIKTGLLAALATRFDAPLPEIRADMNDVVIETWGKVRRVDSEEGDTMSAATAVKAGEDSRDATFVRYEMMVDKFARRATREPCYVLETFYGRLEYIFLVYRPPLKGESEPLDDTDTDSESNPGSDVEDDHRYFSPKTPIIMAAIRSCKLEKADSQLDKLDMHLYTDFGSLDFIGIECIQALVGRVPCGTTGGKWVIIDRSGSLARAGVDDET